MRFEQFLATEIADGVTFADILTVDFMVSLLGNVVAAIAILVAGFVLAAWIRNRIRKVGWDYEALDDTLFNFLGNIARYTILAFTVIFVLNRFGVQTTSMVAALGAVGLAIGLAVQGTLSNIAAGVMIIAFRPIKVGDYVEVNGQGGTVKDISLNYTELASLGNLQIIIPNAEVWGNTIVNYSVYKTRRAEWTFGVGYTADLAVAEDIIRKVILSDERTMADPEPFLKVNALNDFSVDFLVRAWVSAEDYFTYQADIKRRVKEEFDEAGIEIPFPTRTVIQTVAQ